MKVQLIFRVDDSIIFDLVNSGNQSVLQGEGESR